MSLDSGPLPVAIPTSVARTDFNNAMNQLNAAFPLNTPNIGNGKVTPEKAAPGFGRYVPRDCVAPDFYLIRDMQIKDEWVTDGLDLSEIVPVGAIAVTLHFRSLRGLYGEYSTFGVRPNQTNREQNGLYQDLPGQEFSCDVTMPIDADRLIDYYCGTGVTSAFIYVVGWFI